MKTERRIENLLRELAPQVLSTLVRQHGQFDACEDAVQEALVAAALQWPTDGVPARPRSWLLTVAGRSLVDEWRSESARRRREDMVAALEPAADSQGAGYRPGDEDDTLTLLFLCCHPALTPPAQLALTESHSFIMKSDAILLERCHDRWAGMWMLPLTRTLAKDPIHIARFPFTNHAVTLRIFRGRPCRLNSAQRWFPIRRLNKIPIPSPHRRAIASILTAP